MPLIELQPPSTRPRGRTTSRPLSSDWGALRYPQAMRRSPIATATDLRTSQFQNLDPGASFLPVPGLTTFQYDGSGRLTEVIRELNQRV